jgi:hypothetical protein
MNKRITILEHSPAQPAVSGFVETLPAHSDGLRVILVSDQKIYTSHDGAWLSDTPAEGWRCFDNNNQFNIIFQGGEWVEEIIVLDSMELPSQELPSQELPSIEFDPLDYPELVGPQGEQGATGSQGATGPQGETGVQGSTGAQGATGAQGNQGHQGNTGAQGNQGHQGNTGAQGSTGSQGATGAQGSQGHQGNTGAQGETGAQGATGVQGADGKDGPQGATGAQGSQGNTGLQGPQGSTGAQGATGAQGPKGNTGDQGAQGAQGPQGSGGLTNPMVNDFDMIYQYGSAAANFPRPTAQGNFILFQSYAALGDPQRVADWLQIGDNLSIASGKLDASFTFPMATAITAATATLTKASHGNKFIPVNRSTGVTLTLSTGFSVGDEIIIYQQGAGQVTVTNATGVTINSSETKKTAWQYAVISLKCVASNSWVLFGERELS